jgi:methyltransferase (TIGR00027 family)
MDAVQPSRTAMGVAMARDAHRTHDAPPWVFDDPYALVLVGPAWDNCAPSVATWREPVQRQNRASLALRSRYGEDRLLAGLYRQYVIVGAGLDSFCWRRPDLLARLRVFEVDHPATQAWKRARIRELGLPIQHGHVFTPIDFETETLRRGLERAGFDWSQPTFLSWLGVTIYLTTEAIEATLRTVAACGSGSEIVLSYDVSDPFLDDFGREMVASEAAAVASVGEPYITKFSLRDVEALIERSGLEIAEHPTPEVLYARYFANRDDGLRPSTAERLIAARLPI